ncbi:MAG: TIGR00730 family Rossman fold protein [Bacteroidales bacterium]|nr:TIGR00730 family Rossman fold protein [Bacteroidales bacterium]
MRKVCIYCASSTIIAPIYINHAKTLAAEMANNQIEMVFGGSRTGLMGILADEMNKLNGRSIGIMPNFMKDVEWHHKNLTEMIWVDTMAERKEKMIEDVDAVITLPGGCGTMEEFMETLSLKRLGLFTAPMIILNSGGFYDPLIDLLEAMIRENFLSEKHSQMWEVVAQPEDIMPAIIRSKPWDSSAKSFALVQ